MKINIESRELIIKSRRNQNFKNIYYKICENTIGMNINEIHIKYRIKKNNNKYRIFGKNFVQNNYNNCKIILNGKIYNLVADLEIKNCNKKKDIFEIKLRGIKNIIIASEMFFECSSLYSLPDIYKWNTNNIIDINSLFFKCSSLKYLSDISNWNINNITNMSFMFFECSLLKYLPNISKWNTNKVINMSELFSNVYR